MLYKILKEDLDTRQVTERPTFAKIS